MKSIELILVPYDSGRPGERMGAGPDAFVAGGTADALRAVGCDVGMCRVESAATEPLPSAVELAQAAAACVHEARTTGRFPLVLAGNCITTVGAVAGVRRSSSGRTGVVWFDAHGDLNTPATSASGFLDGMAAAVLLGWCHDDAFAAVSGYQPLEQERFALVGARDLDAGEIASISARSVLAVPPARARDEHALDALVDAADDVWLHVDLDVLDPVAHAPANAFAASGGLVLDEVLGIVQHIAASRPIAGMTLSAYDPTVDPDGVVRAAALPIIRAALGTPG